jgi:hypothetical protein
VDDPPAVEAEAGWPVAAGGAPSPLASDGGVGGAASPFPAPVGAGPDGGWAFGVGGGPGSVVVSDLVSTRGGSEVAAAPLGWV